MSASTVEIEALAAEIGEQIYMDVAKWHLFLAEAHLHLPLAEKIFPLLEEDNLNQEAVEHILSTTLVSVGGGKHQLTLLEMLPTTMVDQLMSLLKDYQVENF